MKLTVFVNSIKKSQPGFIIVEAANGYPDGPPFVRFETSMSEAKKNLYIGKKFTLTLEESD